LTNGPLLHQLSDSGNNLIMSLNNLQYFIKNFIEKDKIFVFNAVN